MANVRLDAAEIHHVIRITVCKDDGKQRARLDRIAECSARAVRLQSDQIVCGDARIVVRRHEDLLLRNPVWRREARATAVLTHGAANEL